MTIKYFVTKDMVDSALSDSSENPVQNKVIKAAVDAKLNKLFETTEAGKFLKVDTDGKVITGSPSAQVQSDWSQATTTESDYIKNKPFKTIGTGLSVSAEGVLSAETQFKFQIFTTLPTPSATYAQTIALKLQAGETEKYDEFACVEVTTGNWKWEQIGSTEFKLNIVQTADGIKINDTVLQAATDSQTGLMTAADHTALTGKQDKANLVTAFGATPDDTKYPSEKLVKDQLDLKQTTANLTTTIAAKESASDTKYPSEKAVATAISTAANGKISFATGSTSTAFTIGKDASGYYIEE